MVEQTIQTMTIDKYVISKKKIGEGSQAKVFLGWKKDDPSVKTATKIFQVKKMQGINQKNFKREIDIMQKIENINLVKLYDLKKTDTQCFIIQEYCEDSDFGNYLIENKKFGISEQEAIAWFRQFVNGYNALFNKNIIHRDIKPQNIFLHKGKAKIADFGLAKQLENYQTNEESLHTQVGTPLYMSPQVLNNTLYSPKCDVFSMGVVFYETLYNKLPWQGKSIENQKQLLRDQPLIFPPEPIRSKQIKNLITQMLKYEEGDRLDWESLFNNDEDGQCMYHKALQERQTPKHQKKNTITRMESLYNPFMFTSYLTLGDKIVNCSIVNNLVQQEDQSQIETKLQQEDANKKDILKINQDFDYMLNMGHFIETVIHTIINYQMNYPIDDITFYNLILLIQTYQINIMVKSHIQLTSEENNDYQKLKEYQDSELCKRMNIQYKQKINDFKNKLKKITEYYAKKKINPTEIMKNYVNYPKEFPDKNIQKDLLIILKIYEEDILKQGTDCKDKWIVLVYLQVMKTIEQNIKDIGEIGDIGLFTEQLQSQGEQEVWNKYNLMKTTFQ